MPERDTSATVKERRVEADDLPLRYLVAGEGPPLVLLHGAGANSLDWRWVLPALARTHRVYALDLPGSPDCASYLGVCLGGRLLAQASGEVVNEAIVNYFEALVAAGGFFEGTTNQTLRTLRVVR
jgi:hypothetical protein